MINVTASPNTICIGNTTTLTASGATSYTWGVGGVNTATNIVNPVTTTVYMVTGTTGTCTTTNTITVFVRDSLHFIAVSPSPEMCNGHSSNLNATGVGGDSLLTYTWYPGSLVGQNISVHPNTTTQYTVVLTDACGTPSVSSTVQVTIDPIPTLSFVATPDSGCAPLIASFTAVGVSGILANSWNWFFGDGTSSSGIATAFHTYNTPGTYFVHLTATTIQNCPDSGTIVSLSVTNCAGISQISGLNSNISVYPNPTSSVLHVEYEMANEKSTLVLTDMLGNTVKQVPCNTQHITLNITDFSEGIYNLSISGTAGVVNKRVVIVR